jgi:hypothetical protein
MASSHSQKKAKNTATRGRGITMLQVCVCGGAESVVCAAATTPRSEHVRSIHFTSAAKKIYQWCAPARKRPLKAPVPARSSVSLRAVHAPCGSLSPDRTCRALATTSLLQKGLYGVLACSLAVLAHAGICNDKRIDCANWARDGECSGENAVRAHPPQTYAILPASLSPCFSQLSLSSKCPPL